MSEKIYIGIDYGSSNSCLGIYKNGEVIIIPNKKHDLRTPSIVAFKDEEKIFVGEDISQLSSLKDTAYVYDIKRFLGKKSKDKFIIEQMKKKIYPFNLISDNSNEDKVKIKLKTNEKKNFFDEELKKTIQFDPYTNQKIKKDLEFYPEELISKIFEHLKQCAEEYLKLESKIIKIENAVITVPASFSNIQKYLIKEAAEKAGFKNIRLLSESSAAALAYGMDQNENKENKILVIDIGGGTFDVTLLEMIIEEDYGKNFTEISVGGDEYLGGRDFDDLLMKNLNKFLDDNKKIDIIINFDKLTNHKKKRLKKECEQIKILLSEKDEVIYEIKNFSSNQSINLKITRKAFEDLCRELFEKILTSINKVLNESETKKENISDIILTGGT